MTDADIQVRLSKLKEQVKGILTEIEDIEDHEDQVSGEPLRIDEDAYPILRPSRQWMPLQMVIQEGIDYGMKNPPGVNGYKKLEPGEYVEGPEPTWVSQLKVPISSTLGNKEPKAWYCR